MIRVTEDEHFQPLAVPLNSKGLGLTYSNVAQQLRYQESYNPPGRPSSWSSMKDALLAFLVSSDPKPVQVRIAEEKHQDGSYHYHVYIAWLGNHRVDHRHFDWRGVHPNIQFLRNPRAWNRYIEKDDTPLEWVLTILLDSDDEGYLTPPEE